MVGVINLSPSPRKELVQYMREAALVGAVRGGDSIGMGLVSSDGKKVDEYKDTLCASSFIASKPAHAHLAQAGTNKFTIVHHRAATVGQVSVAAAHPFHYLFGPKEKRRSMLVAHNGTLSSYKDSDGGIKFASDSDWLAYELASSECLPDGRKDYRKVLEGINGSYSVVIATDSEVAFANNGKRPMSVAFSKDGTYLLFASEPAMLSWLIERNAILAGDVYTLDAYQLYRVDISNTSRVVVTQETIKEPVYSPAPLMGLYKRSKFADSGGMDTFDSWYTRVTGSDPVTTTEEPDPHVSGSGQTSTLVNSVSADTAASLLGVDVSCMFNELDSVKGAAFGICWVEADTSDTLNKEAQRILRDGNVMYENSYAAGTLCKNTVYSAKITGISLVEEMRGGSLVKCYYVIVDSVIPAHAYKDDNESEDFPHAPHEATHCAVPF